MERKLLGLDMIEVKFDEDGAGTFEGYASVFGGVDSYGDTILPGAYKKTLKRNAGDRPIRMRWNHWGPVIGKWLEMAEDDKGLRVKGELTPGHSVAQDVYASLKHGAVDGLSIGYRPIQIRDLGDGKRELKEIELVEISVVEEPADLGARVGGIKAISEKNIKAARMWLKRAIKLHEGHMDGSIATSEESQMKMMNQMKKALMFISDSDDSGGGMDGMSKSINSASSLKEVEALLRDAAALSRADACALVSRIKSLTRREGVDERSTSNETALAILALRTHALKIR